MQVLLFFLLEAFQVNPPVNFNSKESKVYSQWDKRAGQLLAVAFTCLGGGTAKKSQIQIFQRSGNCVKLLDIDDIILSIDWSNDEIDLLAAITDTGKLFIWNSLSSKEHTIETKWKSLSCLSWSREGLWIAIGSDKGNLMIFNYSTLKKVPILGKHGKTITNCAWTDENRLILISGDKTFSLNDINGDLLIQQQLKSCPNSVQFYKRTSSLAQYSRVISIALDSNLYLYHMDDPQSSVELALQKKYGSIINHCWFDDDKVIVWCSNNYIVAISTLSSPGKELGCIKEVDQVLDVQINASKVAILFSTSIKFRSLFELNDIFELFKFDRETFSFSWPADGSLISIISVIGKTTVFLAEAPKIIATYDKTIALMKSQTDISIVDCRNPDNVVLTIPTECAMSVIALSNEFLVCYAQFVLYLYRIDSDNNLHEFCGKIPTDEMISDIMLGYGRAFLHCNEKVYIVDLNSNLSSETELRVANNFGLVTSLKCADQFLVALDKSRLNVKHFSINDLNLANEHHFETNIKNVYPDCHGFYTLCLGENDHMFLLDPTINEAQDIGTFGKVENVFWRTSSSKNFTSIIAVWTNTVVFIGRIYNYNLRTPRLEIITKLVIKGNNYIPFLFHESNIYCMSKSGKIVLIPVDALNDKETHSWIDLYKIGIHGVIIGKEILYEKEAFNVPMEHLDIDSAIAAARGVKNLTMAAYLEDLLKIDDINIVKGRVFSAFNENDKAQEFYLRSSCPSEALEMRMLLMNWDIALRLSKTIQSTSYPAICFYYGTQLENNGKINEAHELYQTALNDQKVSFFKEEVKTKCFHSLVRTTFKIGDTSQGMKLLMNAYSDELAFACANILEEMKHYHEAAMLFERLGHYEKACEMNLRVKNFVKVSELIHHVKSHKIWNQYGKYLESQEDYRNAIKAYETAGSFDNVCRIQLEKLKNIDDAEQVVRKTKDKAAANVVMRFFQKIGDHKRVLEFCILADLEQQAFIYAQSNNQMEYFTKCLDLQISKELGLQIASYYEGKGNWLIAGMFYAKIGQYHMALECIIKDFPNEEAVSSAVEIAMSAKSDQITSVLLDKLVNSSVKNSKYLVSLYLSVGNFEEAVRNALISADEMQKDGNYKEAKKLLLKTFQHFVSENSNSNVSKQYIDRLTLPLATLHSYTIVKPLMKMEDHIHSALNLKRVCANIEKFGKNAVPLLTSAVVECDKVGMKKSAFEYAAVLCQPEYRKHIDEKFRKKIELTVRRPETEEANEEFKPCPFCEFNIATSGLKCFECKNILPFCVATVTMIAGMHMTKGSWCFCISCHFPAMYEEMKVYVDSNGSCPMCDVELKSTDLKQVSK